MWNHHFHDTQVADPCPTLHHLPFEVFEYACLVTLPHEQV
jgi:hypothetical protein